MALIVQKYGGTNVGSTERIAQVAERIAGYLAKGHQVAVVVSAMSGETNRLVAMGQELGGEYPSRREMDVLTASGEQVTIALLSIALLRRGIAAKSFLADQIAFRTDAAHGRARIEHIDTQKTASRAGQRRGASGGGISGCERAWRNYNSGQRRIRHLGGRPGGRPAGR